MEKRSNRFNKITYSYTIMPSKTVESTERMINRFDEIDVTVDAMERYPVAIKMLNDLFKKEK